MTLRIRDAEVDGGRVDVLIEVGRIVHVGPPGTGGDATRTLDARGGALLPGLVDHHLHLHALAAARGSVPAGRTRADLARVLASAVPDEHGWIRVVGSADDTLDAHVLDGAVAGPVRVQHRSGALWTLNSAALRVVGTDHPGVERDRLGRPTGRVFRADDWLRTRLPASAPPDLTTVGRELAGYGITAVTDATPDLDVATASALTAVPQRLTLLGVPPGREPPPGADVGPHKIVLPDSSLPDPDALAERIRAAHAVGRGVAVHSVTRESLIMLLIALDAAGRHDHDRVEHASLVPRELIADLRGLTVVTQPGFLADRGDDYLDGVPATEHGDLYRCRSLLEAGVGLALSSDAPYGPVDPWSVVRAATNRRTADGRSVGEQEALPVRRALDAYLTPPTEPGGAPRRVLSGVPADLVLLHDPLRDVLDAPDARRVRATWIGGRLVAGDLG